MAFLAAFNKSVTWNSVAAVAINVTEHEWEEKIELAIATHSGTAGMEALLATILKGTGTVKANSDDAQVITNVASVNIRAGALGFLTINHYAVGSNFFKIPASIESVKFAGVVNGGLCNWIFVARLNFLGGVGGVNTYTAPS